MGTQLISLALSFCLEPHEVKITTGYGLEFKPCDGEILPSVIDAKWMIGNSCPGARD